MTAIVFFIGFGLGILSGLGLIVGMGYSIDITFTRRDRNAQEDAPGNGAKP